MNFRPSSLFTASYRLESRDRAALRSALDTTFGLRAFAGFVGWFGAVLLAAWFSGKTEHDIVFAIDSMLLGRAPLWLYALVLLPPTFAALWPLALRAGADLLARRAADRDVYLDFTPDGIEGSARGLFSRVAWGRVTRLIETPSHLFLLVGENEPLILPRRALPNAEAYANLVGFIRARTGLRSRG